MRKDNCPGFIQLAKKSLAVITASLAALVSSQGKPFSATAMSFLENKELNYKNIQNRFLKTKLVLKLNTNKPGNSIMAMHTSHSSHSSHSSHASYSPPPGHYSHSSHTSHNSHYSSSPSYSPAVNTPVHNNALPESPKVNDPASTSVHPLYSKTPRPDSFRKALADYPLGSRDMYKGCTGKDVQHIQQLLIQLGYTLIADGNFDVLTRIAVINFQKANHLKADGIVGKTTLSLLELKAK